jgi:hypothetical protein
MSSYYTHNGKPRVRRAIFGLTGQMCWEASRPGCVYLVGQGLHFDSWSDAITYATTAPSTPGDKGVYTPRAGGSDHAGREATT